jgi:hypothetical protein
MSSRSNAPRPHKRRGFWYLVRRVPAAFAGVDPRPLVNLSTGIRVTDDPRGHAAQTAVAKLDAGLLRHWQDLKAGRDPDAATRYGEAAAAARKWGVDYLPGVEVSRLPMAELVRRVEVVDDKRSVEDKAKVTAVLGGVQPPVLMVSQMRELFEEVMSTTLVEKSERQLKKWRVQRDSALETFIGVLGGDRALANVKRPDVLAFRSYWQERVVNGEVGVGTGNKCIGRVAGMYRVINDSKMLGLPPVFEKINIRGEKQKQRVAYQAGFVQATFLADGMFDDLNSEARRVIYLVSETGLRLSEACNLARETIRLDDPVPHVRVRADGREMKTDQSRRDIPLVGVALMAMREQPDGFPRYRDKADSLSAVVNKALEFRKLRPEAGQSLYSLRHTFEDRLTAVEAPEKVVASLMGHKWHRPRYGLGPSLEQKLEWLRRIAFRPPASV